MLLKWNVNQPHSCISTSSLQKALQVWIHVYFCYKHFILSGWLLKPWFVIWNPHIRSNFTQSESSRCSASSTLYSLFNKMYGLAQLVIFISSSLTCAGVSVSFIGCPSNLNLICLIDSPWKSIKTCYLCDKFSLVNPLLAPVPF